MIPVKGYPSPQRVCGKCFDIVRTRLIAEKGKNPDSKRQTQGIPSSIPKSAPSVKQNITITEEDPPVDIIEL